MGEQNGGRSPSFERRRAEVLATAKRIFNEQGVRGFSMASVASALDVKPASLTHYFKRRDELITACLLDTIRQYHALLDDAEPGRSPPERLRVFLTGYFELHRHVQLGTHSAPISVSEIRLMTSAIEPHVADALQGVVLRLAALFQDPAQPWLTPVRSRLIARLVIECIDWSAAWLDLYELEEYGEVAERLTVVLCRGFVNDPGRVPVEPAFALGHETSDETPTSRESFLIAATELINLHGYHGVSVDAISAALNLTKGAFYHHNSDKDELLLACCTRTLDLVREAQRKASTAATSAQRLVSAVVALASHQARGTRGHLLRLYVLSELPADKKRRVQLEYKAAALRFAAMISAGIAERQVPPIDPFIGAMVLIAMFNSAAYFEVTTEQRSADLALTSYVRPCLIGVFNA